MKSQILKAVSLSLILSAPLTLGLSATAQEATPTHVRAVTAPAQVAQTSPRDRELNAFAQSKYSYWDAEILANFWGESLTEAKATMGRKVMWGGNSKAYLEQQLLDARIKALVNVNDLKLYSRSGYNYNDAKALAEFWGEREPWDGKLRIERNLILGNSAVISDALRLIRR